MKIGKDVDLVADFVRNSLSLNVPITFEMLCEAIEQKLSGSCIPKDNDEMKVDAQIVTLDEDNFIIYYLKNRPETRILFSISHELGHLFLHLLERDGKLKSHTVCQRDMTQTRQEYEANEFAAALLMPEDEFVSKCWECMNENRINVTKVANYFKVSAQAATVRGNVLGLW